MTKTTTHKCSKETEIAILQKDQEYVKEKIDAIHESVVELNHKLLGNGKPGLIAEQNQRISQIEQKLIGYGVAVSIIVFLITLFGAKIVNAIIN